MVAWWAYIGAREPGKVRVVLASEAEAEIRAARETSARDMVEHDKVIRADEREEIAKMLDGYCGDMARAIRTRGSDQKPGKIGRLAPGYTHASDFVIDKINELIDAENARRV